MSGFSRLKYLINLCFPSVTSWSYLCLKQFWFLAWKTGDCIKVNKDNGCQYESRQGSVSLNSNSGNEFSFGICNVVHNIIAILLPFSPYALKLSHACLMFVMPMIALYLQWNFKSLFLETLWAIAWIFKPRILHSLKKSIWMSYGCPRDLGKLKVLLLKLYIKCRISLFDI